MISVRKLAAVDVAFLGSRLVIAEFALGVAGPLGLGVLTMVRSQSSAGRLFGAYLISLAINYVPLLVHAAQIVRSQSASSEIAGESIDRRQLFAKYRRVSLLLLLPAVVPLISVIEWRARRVPHRSPE